MIIKILLLLTYLSGALGVFIINYERCYDQTSTGTYIGKAVFWPSLIVIHYLDPKLSVSCN